jgi:endonuclease YncB( thermonuclease family)
VAAAGRSDFRRLRLAGPFPAVVTDVIDGDTFEAKVTIWLGHEVTTRVRLLGIDAAEMGSECGEERSMAQVSRAALARMLGREVELSHVRFDKYGGRVLARARSGAHPDISAAMLAGGYAIHYEGGRRQAWCDPVLTSRR